MSSWKTNYFNFRFHSPGINTDCAATTVPPALSTKRGPPSTTRIWSTWINGGAVAAQRRGCFGWIRNCSFCWPGNLITQLCDWVWVEGKAPRTGDMTVEEEQQLLLRLKSRETQSYQGRNCYYQPVNAHRITPTLLWSSNRGAASFITKHTIPLSAPGSSWSCFIASLQDSQRYPYLLGRQLFNFWQEHETHYQ